MCVRGQPEPVGSVLTFPSGYDTLEYSWGKATVVSVRLQILFVTLQNTNNQPCNTTSLALGRVLALLQGLGGYTRGCTDAPPWKKFHTFKEQNPNNWHLSHRFEGLSLCRAANHPYKGSGATVGYHN